VQSAKLTDKLQLSLISDEDLVVLILKRDWEALRELFKRYQKPFFNLAYRFCGDRFVAEDLTSEILWRIYGYLQSFDSQRKFKSWAFKVATNTCMTHVVQSSKFKVQSYGSKLKVDDDQGEYESEVADDKVDLVKETVRNEVSERVQKALMRLPDKYRLALYLYYFEDLKYEEIAEDLNLPVNTVRTHIKRGKEKMKEELRDLI